MIVAKETNTSEVKYSNQTTMDSVDVVTYKLQLDKVKNAAANYADLKGATFELYRGTKADSNKVWFISGTAEGGIPVLTVVGYGSTTTVVGAFSEICLADTGTNHLGNSKVIIKGLDKVEYVLHEKTAPDGYNLAEDTPVATTTLVPINGTITDVANKIGNDDTGVVSVVNSTGSELPSTGGIGTTIFYIVGALLVIGCGIVLISRKRMHD